MATLPHPADTTSDLITALTAAGRLWAAGVPLSWQGLQGGAKRRRVPLPTYPFERQRYLVEAPDAPAPVTAQTSEALPFGDTANESPAVTTELPEDLTMRRIATAFAEVLGLPRVGLHDNFFELGGDSLMAAQLIARLRPHVATPLRVKTLFRAPTVNRLARFVAEALSADAAASRASSAGEALSPGASSVGDALSQTSSAVSLPPGSSST